MEKTCVTFTLRGDERAASLICGMDVSHVRQITALPSASIRRAPGSPSFVEGVVLWQDHMVPVIHLNHLLGYPKQILREEVTMIVTSHGEELMGFLIEDVRDLESGQFDVAESFGTANPGIEGLLRTENDLITVLDPGALLLDQNRGHRSAKRASAG